MRSAMAEPSQEIGPQAEGWLAEMKELYDNRLPQYSQAVVEGAYSVIEGKSRLVQATVLPWHEERLPPDKKCEYPRFVLFRTRLKLDRLWATFENLVRSGNLEVPTIGPLNFGGKLEQPSRHSAASYPFYSEWALTSVKVAAGPDGRVLHEKLSSPDEDLYPMPNDAIEEWTGVTPGWSGFSPAVYLLMPDFRAAISSVEIGATSVRVRARIGSAGSGRLMLRYYAHAEGRDPVHGRVLVKGGAARCEVGFLPSKFLVDLWGMNAREPLDWRDFNASYPRPDSDVKYSLPEEDLRNLIRGGESTFVEFKDRLPSDQLAETVCAFANTQGGRIFIGVSDTTKVLGFESERYGRDHIDSVVRAHLDPVPAYGVRFVKIDRKPIIVIEVPEGGSKPYVLRERGAYIRVNGSDRIANSRETVELCRTQDQ
jgi:hypothetical protein